jgi:hypothetical protein
VYEGETASEAGGESGLGDQARDQSQRLLAAIQIVCPSAGMSNKWLEQQGLFSLKQLWGALAPLQGTA